MYIHAQFESATMHPSTATLLLLLGSLLALSVELEDIVCKAHIKGAGSMATMDFERLNKGPKNGQLCHPHRLFKTKFLPIFSNRVDLNIQEVVNFRSPKGMITKYKENVSHH
jgi:hypothetical protein